MTLSELKNKNMEFFAGGYKGETYEFTTDDTGREVFIITTPFGTRPIYYWDSAGKLHFLRYQ